MGRSGWTSKYGIADRSLNSALKTADHSSSNLIIVFSSQTLIIYTWNHLLSGSKCIYIAAIWKPVLSVLLWSVLLCASSFQYLLRWCVIEQYILVIFIINSSNIFLFFKTVWKSVSLCCINSDFYVHLTAQKSNEVPKNLNFTVKLYEYSCTFKSNIQVSLPATRIV